MNLQLFGNLNKSKWLSITREQLTTIKLILTNEPFDKLLNTLSTEAQQYSLLEATADIAQTAGHMGYYSGDSRADVAQFITWAKEFEAANAGQDWTDKDYIETIDNFTDAKLKEAANKEPADMQTIAARLTSLIAQLDDLRIDHDLKDPEAGDILSGISGQLTDAAGTLNHYINNY